MYNRVINNYVYRQYENEILYMYNMILKIVSKQKDQPNNEECIKLLSTISTQMLINV